MTTLSIAAPGGRNPEPTPNPYQPEGETHE